MFSLCLRVTQALRSQKTEMLEGLRRAIRLAAEAEADGGAAAAPPPSFCPSFVRMPARADEVAYLFDVADSSGKSRATWPVQYRAIAPKHKPMLVFTALFKTAKCKFDRA